MADCRHLALGWKHRDKLNIAAAEGHCKCVRSLINAGADVNHVDNYGCTSLISAAQHGRYKCVNVLLNAGGRVNKRNENGQTGKVLAHLVFMPKTGRQVPIFSIFLSILLFFQFFKAISSHFSYFLAILHLTFISCISF